MVGRERLMWGWNVSGREVVWDGARDLVGVSWCIGVSVASGLGGDLVGEFGGFWEDGVSCWWVGIGVSECGEVLKFKLKGVR
jgi:hypothetical protein